MILSSDHRSLQAGPPAAGRLALRRQGGYSGGGRVLSVLFFSPPPPAPPTPPAGGRAGLPCGVKGATVGAPAGEVHAPMARKRPREHLKVLLRKSQIRQKVRQLARQIERDFKGEPLHLVCILKGACIFLADLLRELDLPVSVDFIAVSSYGKGTLPSGEVRITKDLDYSIENLNVIIVEDILDTGLTLNYLYRILQTRKPKSLKIAALLDKPARRIKEVPVDYVDFKIPDAFVVGYGLDYGERYRNLPDVCVMPAVEA